LCRHHCGESGDLDTEDKRAKEEALKDCTRILSCYQVGGGWQIYILTVFLDDKEVNASPIWSTLSYAGTVSLNMGSVR